MLQNEEFIQEFVEEARIHIEQVESDLLEFAGTGGDTELINQLFRSVHSIKGTAGFFGLDNIVKLAHAMENVFGAVRNGKIELDDSSIDVLLESNDCLSDMVENVLDSHTFDISSYLDSLSAILEGQPIKASPKSSILVRDQESRELQLDHAQQERIEEAVEHGHRLYRIKLRLHQDLDNRGISPIAFFSKIQSIGQILEAYSDVSEIKDLDDVLKSDIEYIFLFTTVLEKSLVALALDIPENSIQELDVNIKPNQYKEVLLEDNQKDKKEKEQVRKEVAAQDKLQDKAKEKEGDKHPDKKEVPKGGPPWQGRNVSLTVEDSIRVPVDLLNELMNLASELVLGRNQLLRGLEAYRKQVEGLDPILQNIDHITTQLQERIMQTRMQPLVNVFNKFPRMIRDLSKQLGKEIKLKITGAQVELDKSIIEGLGDPLTHLIRNAADHGIEKSEVRERQGKDREGIISLGAYQEGSHVSILISDDGAGIDIDKLKAKVLEKELISPQELAAMDESEVLKLIFMPGFSTAQNVTDVSGRGVGMDVVRTNIERMGGTIEIESQPGTGTTFKLNLPLTLAIISSLIVEAEGQKFALPQANLQEMVRVKPGDKDRRIEYVSGSLVLRFRGKLLPIIRLSDVLGLSERDQSTEELQDSNKIVRVLVLKIGQRRYGLIVDAIHDDEEILVKPLPRHLKDCKCYSGVTILGDGSIAMILDADGIASWADLKLADLKEETGEEELGRKVRGEEHTLLLFSCSGSEILTLPLSMVSRVEEISPEDIQLVGDKEYIEFRGRSLRLVRPEDYLPISREEYKTSKLYVIVPKLVKQPIGILIRKIYDTIALNVDYSQQDIKAYGIVGTTFWDRKMVLLLNLYQLFELAAPEYYKTPEETRAKATNYTVLLAEDAPFFRRMEREYLEEAGYRVLEAENGRDALEILKKEKVDALISDINMPYMDGLELISQIRKDEELKNLPAIAVTSLYNESQIQAGLDAGFDFYEIKLDKEMLLEKLRILIQERRSRNAG